MEFINKLIEVRKVGFMAWEAVVQTGSTLYFYTSWTRGGAHKTARKHIQKENERHGNHRSVVPGK